MRIAALQMQSVTSDVQANLARIERAATEAAKGGAELLITPELCLTGYGAGDAITALAETANGVQVKTLAGHFDRQQASPSSPGLPSAMVQTFITARHSSMAVLSLRSIANRTFMVIMSDPCSSRQGPPIALVELGGLKLGMLICYDVEFPENVRRLALGRRRRRSRSHCPSRRSVRHFHRHSHDSDPRLREPDFRCLC